MVDADDRRDRAVPAWVAVFWAAVVVCAVLVPATPAAASHRSVSNHLHNFHYNSTGSGPGANDEQYCIESHDTNQVSNAAGKDFIRQVLTGYTAGRMWDGTGGWRIDLWATSKNCTAYSSATRATIEIEVHYGWDWSGQCGGPSGYYNCVVKDYPLWNADYGHTDYRWAYVYLVFSSGGGLDDRGRAFVNHEFGHVWGLLDDDGTCSPPSLMHSTRVGYGCSNWQNSYPSSGDFSSVVAGMDGS